MAIFDNKRHRMVHYTSDPRLTFAAAHVLATDPVASNFHLEQFTNEDYNTFETYSTNKKQTNKVSKTNIDWLEYANEMIDQDRRQPRNTTLKSNGSKRRRTSTIPLYKRNKRQRKHEKKQHKSSVKKKHGESSREQDSDIDYQDSEPARSSSSSDKESEEEEEAKSPQFYMPLQIEKL